MNEEVISVNASPAEGQRITVILIPQVEDDLRRLQQRTNLSMTDLANRAITLYEFFDARTRNGYDMVARNQDTGETELVQLLDAPGRTSTARGPRLPKAGLTAQERPPGRHRRPRHASGVGIKHLQDAA